MNCGLAFGFNKHMIDLQGFPDRDRRKRKNIDEEHSAIMLAALESI